ncbi:MAG: hypothetical protein WAW96_06410 [Alphaproteobacteria bacterium]
MKDIMHADVYPWAEPTAEQRRMFDALPPREKERLIAEAIEAGFDGGVSDKRVADIVSEAKAKLSK